MTCRDCGRPLFYDGAENGWCIPCLKIAQHRFFMLYRLGWPFIPRYINQHTDRLKAESAEIGRKIFESLHA